MSQVRLTRRARGDLMDIWVSIAVENEAAADIDQDARILTERPYLILYRVSSGGAQIVRVLHGARLIDASAFRDGLD